MWIRDPSWIRITACSNFSCIGQVHDGEADRGERGGGGHGAEAAASPPGHQASTASRQGPARVSQRDTFPEMEFLNSIFVRGFSDSSFCLVFFFLFCISSIQ
jgi:hypothetical protein